MKRRQLRWMAMAGLVAGAVWAARRTRTLDLRGKVVLVTGGSRGLGLAIARRFAEMGARLALCSRNQSELDQAKASLDGEVFTLVCDITQQADVQTLVQSVVTHYGSLDVLVNNAGIIQMAPFQSTTQQDFEDAMKTHYWAPYYSIMAALPFMRRQGSGRIVNIASIGGKIAMPHLLPYASSKFALVGLSEGLFTELAQENIFVTTVCPGLMRTGGHVNAYFRSQQAKEYELFSFLATSPFTAISVERAARDIVEACRRGLPEVILSAPAQIAARVFGLFPGWGAEALALMNRLLPAAQNSGERRQGREIAVEEESIGGLSQ